MQHGRNLRDGAPSHSRGGTATPTKGAGVIKICDLSGLPPGQAVRVVAGDVPPIAVFNTGAEILAVDDTCTHQDASLADGWLEGDTVECPLHATCFDLRTGQPSGPPAKRPVRTHPVLVADGVIYVVPSTATGTATLGEGGGSVVGVEAGPSSGPEA
jgi:3-phenylpropionate/trans-cinnamate dioxygenase ferredoxin subunit